jgi:hypothetical protein
MTWNSDCDDLPHQAQQQQGAPDDDFESELLAGEKSASFAEVTEFPNSGDSDF